jgi:hypothetical protein
MVDLVDYGEGKQNSAYYLFLLTPFIYAAIIVLLYLKGSSTLGFTISWYYYLSIIYGLATIGIGSKVKKDDWKDRRKNIHKPADFYSAYYENNMLGLALSFSAGTIGMLIFLITGDLILPAILLVLSLIGLMKEFPTAGEMTEKRKEIQFTNEQV